LYISPLPPRDASAAIITLTCRLPLMLMPPFHAAFLLFDTALIFAIAEMMPR